jgi:D-alanyl-D-alanine carboxypeptidase
MRRDLRAVLDNYRRDNHLPALTAAAWQGGELVAAETVGIRRYGDPTPATNDDQWHLGSDGKAMTATLVGLCVDRGILRFEDRLGDLATRPPLDPDRPGLFGTVIHPGYAAMTIQEVLQHRAGLPGELGGADNMLLFGGLPPSVARTTLARTLLSMPPAYEPGRFLYANVGYMTIGVILEQCCGATWESLIRTELFAPLRMASAGFGAPGTPGTVDQPWGHLAADQPIPPGTLYADNPLAYGPAGLVHCSLADWHRFLAQHLAGARGEPSMLEQATMTRLHELPPHGAYACGWIVVPVEGAKIPRFSHSGSNGKWAASVWLLPDENIIAVAATNRRDPDAPDLPEQIALGLAEATASGCSAATIR